MKKAIVFLRSFGDFTIAISVLRKSKSLQDHVFYASVHLEPLYNDLRASLSDIEMNIQFIDFGIRKKIFGYFTNKYTIELHSFTELMKLRKWLRGIKDKELYFEQRRKQWMIAPFLGGTYPYIHEKSRNIYDSYLTHVGVAPEMLTFQAPPKNEIHNILLLPESRKKSKSFQPSFIHELASSLMKRGFDVTTAFFKNIPIVPVGKVRTHDSFSDLISLVQAADLVLTADSLPAHLSQLLNRAHFVCYDGRPNPEWMTPFIKQEMAFGVLGDVAGIIDFIQPMART